MSPHHGFLISFKCFAMLYWTQRRKFLGITIAIWVVMLSWPTPTPAQNAKPLAPEVRKQIRDIDKAILAAGRLFRAQKFDDSAKLIGEAQTSMGQLTESADAKTIDGVQNTYKKLAKAHELLTAKGQSLQPLVALPQPKAVTGGKVSFVSQVAPILMSKCGNCHVGNNKGNFSAASFRNLDNSAMIAYGVADESRLIEVIQLGEMPKGDLKVSAGELEILKQWVNQGAEFDGANPNANLASFVNPPAAMATTEMASGPMKPTGEETVSFGLHIAPILLENCAQCHIARNPRGNFNMANFAGILRGGDGGKVFEPGSSGTSEIVLRLKGEDRDVMPPSGKLDDKLIALVSQWIDEGAKFDPADVRLTMKAVAGKGIANSLNHEELTEMRKKTSEEIWRLALGGVEPSNAATENFLMIGTGSSDRLKKIGDNAESIARRVEKILKTSSGQPFVKGGTTLFVVDKRYDFSEFGRMVEKRTFPKTMISSWQFDSVNAHVALLCGMRDEFSDYEVPLSRDITSVHVANWDPSVPRWFADGMGHWVASKMFRRDPVVQQWEKDSYSAIASMKKPDDFLGNNMAADQAALVGFRFVETLQAKNRPFKMLVKKLHEDGNFEVAFYESFGITPEEFFKSGK